jgi:hypothetical protein
MIFFVILGQLPESVSVGSAVELAGADRPHEDGRSPVQPE